jgi:tRNA G18 (ribose-2'-O)-methylase SpoU
LRQLEHEEIKNQTSLLPLQLACDSWADPRNVGSAFRLADAFGVAALILGGITPHPPHRRIAKTARSTHEWIPFAVAEDLPAYLRQKKQAGWLPIGLEYTSQSIDIATFTWPAGPGLILVAGAESRGIAEPVLAELTATVHLPMYGRNTSLNVATAIAAALYALRQKWPGTTEQ